MSWYILGAYFSSMLPILTGAKENTLLDLNCYLSYYLSLSMQLVKNSRKMCKVFYSTQETYCQPFINLNVFGQIPL